MRPRKYRLPRLKRAVLPQTQLFRLQRHQVRHQLLRQRFSPAMRLLRQLPVLPLQQAVLLVSATSIAVTQAAAPASSETENNHTKNVVVSKTLAAMPVVDDAGTPSTVVFTKTNPRGTATVTAPNVSIFAGDTSIDKVVDSNFTAFGNGSLATFTLAPNWVITGSTAANNIDYTHPLNPFASDGLLGPFLTFQNSAGTVGDMLASQVGRPNDANVPIWIAGSSYKTPAFTLSNTVLIRIRQNP